MKGTICDRCGKSIQLKFEDHPLVIVSHKGKVFDKENKFYKAGATDAVGLYYEFQFCSDCSNTVTVAEIFKKVESKEIAEGGKG
jgi:hypothetical protein